MLLNDPVGQIVATLDGRPGLSEAGADSLFLKGGSAFS